MARRLRFVWEAATTVLLVSVLMGMMPGRTEAEQPCSAAHPCPIGSVVVKVKGSEGPISFGGLRPVMENGRLLVPAEGLFRALDIAVEISPQQLTLIASRGTHRLLMQVDSTTATIDGEPVKLELPPRRIGGQIYVPLRFSVEAFGKSLIWDGASGNAVIGEPKWYAIFLSGINSDPQDPRFTEFLQRLRPGFDDALVIDYWGEEAPRCGFFCRGHWFLSEWRRERSTVSDNVVQLIQQTEIWRKREPGDKLVLIGYSMGGTIAANSALRMYDEATKRSAIDYLILIGAPVLADTSEQLRRAGIDVFTHNRWDCDTVSTLGARPETNRFQLLRAVARQCHLGDGYFGTNTVDQTAQDVLFAKKLK